MSYKKINIPKDSLEKILKPISKLNESCCLKIKNDILYAISASENSSLFLYTKLKLPENVGDNIRLNFINIKKFLSGLDILEDENFSLYLGENNIKCESEKNSQKTFFKYHLVDDSIIKEFPFNVKKFEDINFDSEFEISTEKIKKILSASSFATETQKVYFEYDDSNIYAILDDESRQNIDNIKIPISKKLIGRDLTRKIPISLEIFKNISYNKENIKIKINSEFDILVFTILEENSLELKYIVSALNN
jgi:hypothetical protein